MTNGALTEPQATELAKRIINALRPTPPLDDWVRALTGRNSTRAWRIYQRAVETCEDGLRIATFLRLYDAEVSDERRARAEQTTPCEHCQGTGYVAGEPIVRQVNGEPYEYSTATPCRCNGGGPNMTVLGTPPEGT